MMPSRRVRKARQCIDTGDKEENKRLFVGYERLSNPIFHEHEPTAIESLYFC